MKIHIIHCTTDRQLRLEPYLLSINVYVVVNNSQLIPSIHSITTEVLAFRAVFSYERMVCGKTRSIVANLAAALELVQHASKLHVKGYQESTILFGIQVFVEVLGEHIQRNVQCLTRNEHLQHGKLSPTHQGSIQWRTRGKLPHQTLQLPPQ
jgi:hypothetical protein